MSLPAIPTSPGALSQVTGRLPSQTRRQLASVQQAVMVDEARLDGVFRLAGRAQVGAASLRVLQQSIASSVPGAEMDCSAIADAVVLAAQMIIVDFGQKRF